MTMTSGNWVKNAIFRHQSLNFVIQYPTENGMRAPQFNSQTELEKRRKRKGFRKRHRTNPRPDLS